MVNENQGGIYRPKPVYCRRLMREVIRNQIRMQHGQHDVNKLTGVNFRRIRKGMVI